MNTRADAIRHRPACPARLLAWFLVAAVLLMGGAAVAHAQAGADSPASKVTILVLPFEINASPELAYLHDSLPQLLGDRLAQEGFNVVPYETMRSLLVSQKVDYLDIQATRQLALLAGATWAVYGSFSQAGESISIDARLVDGFGLKPVKTLFVTRKGLINVLPAIEELGGKVKNEFLSSEQIASIEVQGTEALDKDVVLARVNSQRGEVYDPKKVNDDLRRIYELGYFDDVQILVEDTQGGKKLIYRVKEKPRIAAISFNGNEEIDNDKILETISTKVGAVLNPAILADDLNKIRELYGKDGYYRAEVTSRVVQEEGNRARLEFDINEGKKLYIREIVIEGANQISPSDLKGELALSERGFLSWITGSGILKQELLDRDAAAIEAYYTNRGFIDVKVGTPTVDFAEDGIVITFKVEEGERYKVGDVTFKGDMLVDVSELEQRIRMDDLAKEGDYFNRSVMRSDVGRLTEFYADYGYAYAEAETDVTPHRDTHTVDVIYNLRKNQKVFVRRVIIEGNTKTRDNVIRREMRLADGDLFSGSKLSRSSERLIKLNYFSAVDIEPVPTGDPSQVDLKVNVKDKNTGSMSGGVGYSSTIQAYISASVKESNLFGRGYSASMVGTLAGRGSSYVISFTNPHYEDTDLSVGGDLYYTTYNYDNSYKKDTRGGRVRFGYPVGEYTNLFWGYRLDNYNIHDVADDASDALRDFEGNRWASVLETAIRRDTTNNSFLPTRGSVNKISADLGGGFLGGDDEFYKVVYDTGWYFELFKNNVFHWRAQIGYLGETWNDVDVPVYERFVYGSIDTVRGYDHRIGKVDDSGDVIGGNKGFFTNFEYIFPVYKEMEINGVAFFDMGNTWDFGQSYFEDTKDNQGDSLFLGLYKSVGLGIRWNSPIGPLRIEYGFPLDELRESSKSGKFEFSIGSQF